MGKMSSVLQVNPRVQRIRVPNQLQSLAAQITVEVKQGAEKSFKKVIDVSSGDLHGAGMAPVSFVRQVLAVCLYPELLQEQSLPLDVKQRAQELLAVCSGGSVGSYSPTCRGIPHVLRRVSEFIMRRDGGVTSHAEDIIFSGGSQKALSMVFHLMCSGEGHTQTAVLIPLPCPHTLHMLMDENGVTAVPYPLTEERGWAFDLEQLRRTLVSARGRCIPRAIYISNPGNPTGHVQDRRTMEELIRFAADQGLMLLAEEVYQDSVYGQDKVFLSYKKVLFDMGKPYSDTVELISFNSISSACMGECGLRGGYMEVVNVDPAVGRYLKNMQSTSTPTVLAQLCLEVMVNPPSPGDPSYETYSQEIQHTLRTLSHNAQRACEFLNDLPGLTCQPAVAGIFLYPRLNLPPQMMEEAKRLLEEEGLRLGAGCENGETDANYHLRLCVLAPPATLEEVLARLRSFHLRLLHKYS